jgi:hypothetical protein
MSNATIESLTRVKISNLEIRNNKLKFETTVGIHLWGLATVLRAVQFLLESESESQAKEFNLSVFKKSLRYLK